MYVSKQCGTYTDLISDTGIKFDVLTDGGYTLHFELNYSAKYKMAKREGKVQLAVIKTLLASLKEQGRTCTVVLDSGYATWNLAKWLEESNYAYVMSTRSNFPSFLFSQCLTKKSVSLE